MDQEEDFPIDEKPALTQKGGVLGVILAPFYWLKKLSDELHWSFVLGVMIVYGINQGLSLGLSKVSTQYYMKDEQKLQPSEAQVYFALIQVSWIVKPLWGLFTDTVPIAGRRRRPYFIFAGGRVGAAVAGLTIDACVTENSISHPSLAGDMQSLCGLSSSVGQLIGYAISGFQVHRIGSKGVFQRSYSSSRTRHSCGNHNTRALYPELII